MRASIITSLNCLLMVLLLGSANPSQADSACDASTLFDSLVDSDAVFTAQVIPSSDPTKGYLSRVRVDTIWKGTVDYEPEIYGLGEETIGAPLLLIFVTEREFYWAKRTCSGARSDMAALTESFPAPLYSYDETNPQIVRHQLDEPLSVLTESDDERARLQAWSQLDRTPIDVSILIELGEKALKLGYEREATIYFDRLSREPQPIVVSGLASIVRQGLGADLSAVATDRLLDLVKDNSLSDSATVAALLENFEREMTGRKLAALLTLDVDQAALTELVVQVANQSHLDATELIVEKQIQDRRLIPSRLARFSAAPSRRTAQALGIQGSEVVPGLITLLSHTESDLRELAAIGIGASAVNRPSVLHALHGAAVDSDWSVRVEAALALERLHTGQGWLWYERWVQQEYDIAEDAVMFLTALTSDDAFAERAYTELGRLLWHDTLSEDALDALWKWDTNAAVALPALRLFVKTGPEDLREDAEWAISAIEQAIQLAKVYP